MGSVNELTTLEWFHHLVEPAFILTKAMSYYIDANIKAILRGQILAPILQFHRLRDEAFGRFWVAFSSNREEPIQEQNPSANTTTDANTAGGNNSVQNSADLIPPILAQASGMVLDVGPGTGTQMPLLRLVSPNIKAVYGAEPCLGLHGELRKRAIAEGLGEKYHILACSAVAGELETELEKQGLLSSRSSTDPEGVFDTVITVRVLCSVPEMERTIRGLYSLLKPGGKLLVVEHVVNPWRTAKGSVIARFLQGVYHLFGWRWVMGDCCLNRDTEGVIRRVGGWESVEVERWFGRTPIPYIAGVFVKKST